MKINLGSHNKRIEGYLNMDIQDLENVDALQDLTDPPYYIKGDMIPDNSVDEVLCHEVLEHIPFRKLSTVIDEVYRIIKPGGVFNVQVPDIGLMCEYYVDRKICDCVPRKTDKLSEYKADEMCKKCGGKAIIHPERWKFAFCGAQKHKYDAHLNHFTRHDPWDALLKAGFERVEQVQDIYKLKLRATK